MLLSVSNLSISYGKNLTVQDVSFDLEEGKILTIVG